ncbi:MAG: AraC family transcriptional regulator [Verrucomicrobia bacterium]|nr:AraC family transcriptional regulator [Verrucomicrobiota bacterium]
MQIAAQLGYADIFCFSRQFKKRTGMSPTAFRRNAQ